MFPPIPTCSTYAPPQVEELWDETEDDDNYEYGYLEGRWEGGHHRKWCAILDREQFEEFVDRCGLIAESTETMGSLGAPGFGFGWAPAISFNSDDPDAIQCAYVTPIPEVSKEPPMNRIGSGCGERCWPCTGENTNGAPLISWAGPW